MFKLNGIATLFSRQQPSIIGVEPNLELLEDMWLGQAVVIEPALPSQNPMGIVERVGYACFDDDEPSLYVVESGGGSWATWINVNEADNFVPKGIEQLEAFAGMIVGA